MRIAAGDLVRYNSPWLDDVPWLVLHVTKCKKVWHRNVVLYRAGDIVVLPYKKLKDGGLWKLEADLGEE